MTDIAKLKTLNAQRWQNLHVTASPVLSSVSRRLIAAKARYQAVSAATGVPWAVIAVIHQRESSQSWTGSLAQGDPWNKVSVHVPRGRGPFPSWEAAAIDALKNCPPHAARWTDWSVGGTLTLLEEYNGLGYANMGRPSPYVWAGTNQYVSGKYTSDGRYSPSTVDHQLGCAALLKTMEALGESSEPQSSPTVRPLPTPATQVAKPQTPLQKAPKPSVAPKPFKPWYWVLFAAIIAAFTRKKP